MYSALQQQCLQQLGIPLYQLKEGAVAVDETQQTNLDWSLVDEGFLQDVKVLFPNASVSELGLELTENYLWSLIEQGEVSCSEQGIVSPLPSKLTSEQMRKLWSMLSQVEGA